MEWNNIKEAIISMLSKHQRGLSIADISKNLKTHRHTVSRYIFALQEAGVIECHDAGRAKMCVLKRGVRK